MFTASLVAIGAILGAWLRWGLTLALNPAGWAIPLGTLAANLVGAFFMGLLISSSRDEQWLSHSSQVAIGTGFLGALTTFSAFSAEMAGLLTTASYSWLAIGIGCHVGGSLVMTLIGIAVGRALATSSS